jgi:hypothetical protein
LLDDGLTMVETFKLTGRLASRFWHPVGVRVGVAPVSRGLRPPGYSLRSLWDRGPVRFWNYGGRRLAPVRSLLGVLGWGGRRWSSTSRARARLSGSGLHVHRKARLLRHQLHPSSLEAGRGVRRSCLAGRGLVEDFACFAVHGNEAERGHDARCRT